MLIISKSDTIEIFVHLVSSTKGNKVVHILKKLATAQASTVLSQHASRVQSTVRFGSSSLDPFSKVKELVSDMLAKLQKEAEEDATQKAFCDKEMKETKAKKDDKTAEIEKLSIKKEQKEAQSTKLKEEVATLQKELAELCCIV